MEVHFASFMLMRSIFSKKLVCNPKIFIFVKKSFQKYVINLISILIQKNI